MTLLDNIDNVAFTSSLEVDKLHPLKISGNFTAVASSRTSYTVSNPYGQDVLPVMQFSPDNTSWYEAGGVVYDGSGGSLLQATCYTTTNSVVIVAEEYSGSPSSCYFRLALISDD